MKYKAGCQVKDWLKHRIGKNFCWGLTWISTVYVYLGHLGDKTEGFELKFWSATQETMNFLNALLMLEMTDLQRMRKWNLRWASEDSTSRSKHRHHSGQGIVEGIWQAGELDCLWEVFQELMSFHKDILNNKYK